jgi:3'(2'), 5'-bisphosphate nucleotidase
VSENQPAPAFVDHSLMVALTALASRAAHAILTVRETGIAARRKADDSPVTAADETSEAILLEGLARLMPGIPAVSEEQAQTRKPTAAQTFLLIDPLDGTREFIAGRDEFTINIGIVVDGVPVAGLIAAPARQLVWRGVVGRGAERVGFASSDAPTPVRIRSLAGNEPVALISRSHLDDATARLLDRAAIGNRQGCGSALKFCLLAQGDGDIYPRLAPTSAWDIAAGHALLVAAGGMMARPDGTAIRYADGAGDLKIPDFVACGDAAVLARIGWPITDRSPSRDGQSARPRD